MRFLTRLSAGALGVVLLGGCFDLGSGDGCDVFGNGLAQNGNFSYACIGRGDPYCDPKSTVGTPTTTLPTAIARGGRFRLTFDSSGNFGNSGKVTPVSANAVDTSDGEFIARVVGMIGFVALPSSGSDAVDAVRLKVVEPDGLEIDGLPGPDPGAFVRWSGERHTTAPRVVAGTMTTLRAIATSDESPLAGVIGDVVWTADPSDGATVFGFPDGLANITPLRPGPISITANSGGRVASVRVEVDPAPPPPLPDGGADADASDAGDALDASDAGGDQ